MLLSDQSEPIQDNEMCVTCNTHRRDEAPALNIRRKSQTAENTLKQRCRLKSIEIILTKCEGADWIHRAHDRILLQLSCEHANKWMVLRHGRTIG